MKDYAARREFIYVCYMLRDNITFRGHANKFLMYLRYKSWSWRMALCFIGIDEWWCSVVRIWCSISYNGSDILDSVSYGLVIVYHRYYNFIIQQWITIIRQIVWVLITCMGPNCWVSWFWNWWGGTDVYCSHGDADLSRYVHSYTRHYYGDMFHIIKFAHSSPVRIGQAYQPPLPDDNNWHLWEYLSGRNYLRESVIYQFSVLRQQLASVA